jgi:hypothetical protein
MSRGQHCFTVAYPSVLGRDYASDDGIGNGAELTESLICQEKRRPGEARRALLLQYTWRVDRSSGALLLTQELLPRDKFDPALDMIMYTVADDHMGENEIAQVRVPARVRLCTFPCRLVQDPRSLVHVLSRAPPCLRVLIASFRTQRNYWKNPRNFMRFFSNATLLVYAHAFWQYGSTFRWSWRLLQPLIFLLFFIRIYGSIKIVWTLSK